jgi:hypothetical protein
MNDPLEDLLRQLRPSPFTARLSERLASPPDLENERDQAGGARWWFAAAGAAAAVCGALLLPGAPEEKAVSFARSKAEQLLDARRLAVVDDGSRRAWEIVELEFLDEETLVGGNGALAMRTQTVRHQLVPVELRFD